MEVYLDNAATTRVCPEAADIAYKTMLETYGNPSSTHTKGREAKAVLDNARKQLAPHWTAHLARCTSPHAARRATTGR